MSYAENDAEMPEIDDDVVGVEETKGGDDSENEEVEVEQEQEDPVEGEEEDVGEEDEEEEDEIDNIEIDDDEEYDMEEDSIVTNSKKQRIIKFKIMNINKFMKKILIVMYRRE